MFNDRSTPLSLLLTRRSAKPRDLVAPGPSDEDLAQALAVAVRTPDHGKLAPWRFVTVGSDQRERLSRVLCDALTAERPDATKAEVAKMDEFARQAPTLVVALSSPNADSKVPVWEQELSAGAACMNLIHAVHALGYAAGWLTGWPAYSDAVRDAFGGEGERIVGFVFVGTPAGPLSERPRGDVARAVVRWGQ